MQRQVRKSHPYWSFHWRHGNRIELWEPWLEGEVCLSPKPRPLIKIFLMVLLMFEGDNEEALFFFLLANLGAAILFTF